MKLVPLEHQAKANVLTGEKKVYAIRSINARSEIMMLHNLKCGLSDAPLIQHILHPASKPVSGLTNPIISLPPLINEESSEEALKIFESSITEFGLNEDQAT